MSALPKKMLLATDGSADAALATRAAVDLCKEGGSELHLVHVWRDVPSPYAHDVVRRELERQGREVLDKQARRIEGEGIGISGTHLRQGRISDEVIRLGEEIGASLLILGSRGHGRVGRILMGSHSEEVVHRARLPVLVLRREAVWPPVRLVFGYDHSEGAKRAAELAAALGGLFGIREAVLVHAYPRLLDEVSDSEAAGYAMRRAEKDLEARAAELEGSLGYRPRTKLAAGDAAIAVLKEAQEGEEPALVAVGSRGLGETDSARLGSTSTKVVLATPGPVLIYPHTT